VLLTSYNRGRFLPQAVESVATQTMSDWELIILDDNSSDPSVADYLQSIWRHPRIIVYKSDVFDEDRPNTCRYATQINIGLKIANGRYITYLCDDDWYEPHRLEVMASALDAGADVVYSTQGIVDESGNFTGMTRQFQQVSDPYCAVNHSSVMHTAIAGSTAGGWDESPEHWSIGDAVFWRRLCDAGYFFQHVGSDEPLDYHRDLLGVNKLGGPY
jgi:glycosyltransferase involved in cell wall biosynthesis